MVSIGGFSYRLVHLILDALLAFSHSTCVVYAVNVLVKNTLDSTVKVHRALGVWS